MPIGIHRGVAHLSRRCIVCRTEYVPHQDTQRFCGRICRSRYHQHRMAIRLMERLIRDNGLGKYMGEREGEGAGGGRVGAAGSNGPAGLQGTLQGTVGRVQQAQPLEDAPDGSLGPPVGTGG